MLNFAAGTVAAAAATLLTQPTDVIRTHMQLAALTNPASRSSLTTLRSLLRAKGLSILLAGAGPRVRLAYSNPPPLHFTSFQAQVHAPLSQRRHSQTAMKLLRLWYCCRGSLLLKPMCCTNGDASLEARDQRVQLIGSNLAILCTCPQFDTISPVGAFQSHF